MSWEIAHADGHALPAERVPVCQIGGTLPNGDSWGATAIPFSVPNGFVLLTPKHVLLETDAVLVQTILSAKDIDSPQLELSVDDWTASDEFDVAGIWIPYEVFDTWTCWRLDGPSATLKLGPLDPEPVHLQTVETPLHMSQINGHRMAKVSHSSLLRAEWLERDGAHPVEFRVPIEPVDGMSGDPVFGRLGETLCFVGMVTAAIDSPGDAGCAVLSSQEVLGFGASLVDARA